MRFEVEFALNPPPQSGCRARKMLRSGFPMRHAGFRSFFPVRRAIFCPAEERVEAHSPPRKPGCPTGAGEGG